MKALIVNDTHCAVVRTSGTTLPSAALLRHRIISNFENLIMEHTDKDLIHAGDLLDKFDVPRSDILLVFMVLSRWLEASGKTFYGIRGNHDHNPRADKVSAWHFLMDILVAQYGDRVRIVGGTLTKLEGNVYALGHCDNQDVFSMELERALELEDSVLIAHANYDNHFAEQSDHSLNISEEWAKQFVAKGNRLYSGHEHQKREPLGGKVVMFGTQDATSIADCLGNSAKYAHILEEDGSLTPIQTMDVDAEFIQVDWQELDTVGDQNFVRVIGKATAEDAANVIGKISKFRQHSKSLLVVNSVKIEGASNIEEFDGVSLDQIKAFDVLSSLLEQLDTKQQKAVKALLED